MFDHPLSIAARVSVTVSAAVFALVVYRAVFGRSRRGAAVLAGGFVVAAAFSHVGPLIDTLPRALPIGMGLAFAAVVGSLLSARARAAFDRATDAEVRIMLSFRAIFGGLLMGLAGMGHLPVEFAVSAGLGDLAVTWLAFAIPTRLDASGPRAGRILVHAVGLADMAMVLVSVATYVRPWSVANGNVATAMTLPWLAVPLMVALNAHGLRAAIGRAAVVGDGSQPARGLRSALS